MALKIRLARGGAKKDAHYSVVVIEDWRSRDGKFIKKVGHYHPTMPKDSKDRVVMDVESLKYWISCGALPSQTVLRLIEKLGLGSLVKKKVQPRKSSNIGMSKKEVAAAKKEAEEKLKAAQKAKLEAKKAAEAQKKAEQEASSSQS